MLDLPPPNPPTELTPATHLEQVVVNTEEASAKPCEHCSQSRDIAADAEVTLETTTATEEEAHSEAATDETSHVETAAVTTDESPAEATEASDEAAHSETASAPSDDDLLARAKEIKAVFDDGFQWSDLGSIVKQAYDFVVSYQDMSEERMEEAVVGIISHLIDITDTPYLPDRFTDPLFKSMVPPFVNLFGKALSGRFEKLPTAESEKPTGEDLIAFAKKLKATFDDGFQWSDLSTVVNASMEFIGSFPFLPTEEKKECVIDIVNHLIDITDTPKLPDNFIDPIFKSMIPSFVEILFDKAF